MRSQRNRVRLLPLLLLVTVVLSLGVGAAFAATPNDVQYNQTSPTSPTDTGGVKGVAKAPLAPAKAGGTLPFTGLDLGIAVAGAGLVLAGGVALRRLGRKTTDPEA